MTRAELVRMALEELLIIGSGQDPAAEDSEKVDSRVDGLFEELSDRGIVTITDDDDIPTPLSGPLSELLANESARAFGRERMSAQDRETIEERIRVMINRSEPQKLKIDPALSNASGRYSLAKWRQG